VHVVSLVTLKGLRIVHVPGSLLGYEPQFLAIFLNCTHDGCQPSPHFRWSLECLIGRVLRESDDDAQGKAHRENGEQESFQGKNLRSMRSVPRHLIKAGKSELTAFSCDMLTNLLRCYRNFMEGRGDRLERLDLPAATKGDEYECRNVCRRLHQWRQEREALHASLISYHARLGNVKNVPAGISERQALSNRIRFSRSRDPIIKYDSLSILISPVDVSASLAGLEHRDVQLFPIISRWEWAE
jgi:hypothetical protein